MISPSFLLSRKATSMYRALSVCLSMRQQHFVLPLRDRETATKTFKNVFSACLYFPWWNNLYPPCYVYFEGMDVSREDLARCFENFFALASLLLKSLVVSRNERGETTPEKEVGGEAFRKGRFAQTFSFHVAVRWASGAIK